jgi:hypothetical protein
VELNVSPEIDPDEVQLLFMGDLASKNGSRYESQAESLTKSGSLIVSVGDFLIKYSIAGIGCKSEISLDKGSTYHVLGERRLEGSKRKKEFTLFWEFAYSESRAILEFAN